MKPNISMMNAIMRITCGLTAIAWATSKMSRRRNCLSFIFVAMMGAMKVAEGIHRYCPVTDILKNSTSGASRDHHHREKDEGKEHKEGKEKDE